MPKQCVNGVNYSHLQNNFKSFEEKVWHGFFCEEVVTILGHVSLPFPLYFQIIVYTYRSLKETITPWGIK